MKVELTRTFEFSAAHGLPKVDPGHKCRATHGHNYAVDIAVRGTVDPVTGWLIDFGDLKQIVGPVIERLDHQSLNEIEGLENPTSEMLARWIWEHLFPFLPQLHSITIHETPNSRCTYWGEG